MHYSVFLQYWSNGRYRATPHRVRVSEESKDKSRLSIALFVHPNHDVDVSPLGVQKKNEHAKTAQEHIMERFQATYSE